METNQHIEPYSLVEAEVELGRFPYLDIITRRWAFLLESTLFELLGVLVEVQPTSTECVRFSDFCQELQPQQAIYVFTGQDLPGKNLLLVNNRFAHACLASSSKERLEAQPDELPQFDEEKQQALLNVLQNIMSDFEQSWRGVSEPSFEFQRVVTHRFRAKLFPSFEKCLVLKLLMHAYGFDSDITLCFPYLSLDPILQRFPKKSILPPESIEHYYPHIEGAFQNILQQCEYDMHAVLGSVEVRPQQGKALCVGQVLPIESKVGEALTLRVNGNNVLTAEMGETEGRYAVRIKDTHQKEAQEYRQRPRSFTPLKWSKKS